MITPLEIEEYVNKMNLSKEQQDELTLLNGIIDYIYKTLDPAKWQQMQFDKIFKPNKKYF